MDYFYKRFDYLIDTCKLMGFDVTILTSLNKHSDDTKYAGKWMDAMCIIETADAQHLYNICNELENGKVLGESTDMYPDTIAKAYDVICKYNTPENIMCHIRNHVAAILNNQG